MESLGVMVLFIQMLCQAMGQSDFFLYIFLASSFRILKLNVFGSSHIGVSNGEQLTFEHWQWDFCSKM